MELLFTLCQGFYNAFVIVDRCSSSLQDSMAGKISFPLQSFLDGGETEQWVTLEVPNASTSAESDEKKPKV